MAYRVSTLYFDTWTGLRKEGRKGDGGDGGDGQAAGMTALTGQLVNS